MNKRSKSKKIIFVCNNCGHDTPRWAGRCPNCGEWNSLSEEKVVPSTSSKRSSQFTSVEKPTLISDVNIENSPRIKSGTEEFDRVLGGGLVPGSLILIGGDPGIGKSTLILQRMANYANSESDVLYISGEESNQQVRMRSLRLGINSKNLWLYPEVNLTNVLAQIEKITKKRRPETC